MPPVPRVSARFETTGGLRLLIALPGHRDRLAKMKENDDQTIGHVSDTALCVAVYRAEESERPDALFRDPLRRAQAPPQTDKTGDHLSTRSARLVGLRRSLARTFLATELIIASSH